MRDRGCAKWASKSSSDRTEQSVDAARPSRMERRGYVMSWPSKAGVAARDAMGASVLSERSDARSGGVSFY